ncbi:hypothetical protein B0J13DRAFT_622654 [Dactylonectria estremocensis]|uniref:Uncharacterized protein n=1 Tax=Dactylonectria estremocensis TaxID=1079267 RepID=A0A9P9J3Q9_9HYPO|nr:hypothetical protein B0J13DRAFT_622654 [Dactylonectria estremocensis]
MKCSLILALASVTAVMGYVARPKEMIDMDARINFGWCREANDNNTCDERPLEHGRCYNFELLGKYMDNNIESLNVTGGRCVMWENHNCGGDHTGMFMGTGLIADQLCPGYSWSTVATSVKCCGGDHDAMWCANPGDRVKCTS